MRDTYASLYEIERVLRRELAAVQRPRVEYVEAGSVWMRFPLCTADGLAVVSVRVEEGAIDLTAARELRDYIDIWIRGAERHATKQGATDSPAGAPVLAVDPSRSTPND